MLRGIGSKKTINMSSIKSNIEFTRINNDVNGNPRYVCHYNVFLSETEKKDYSGDWLKNRYATACKRANKLGGKKFHNKQYGGGIVFQSYNNNDLVRHINELMATIK